MPNPNGQQVNTSHSGGLRIRDLWCKLFLDNEANFSSGQFQLVLTDEQLVLKMVEAFPDHWQSAYLRNPRRRRWHYNRGSMTGNRKPKIQSRKFIRNMDDSVWAVSARGAIFDRSTDVQSRLGAASERCSGQSK